MGGGEEECFWHRLEPVETFFFQYKLYLVWHIKKTHLANGIKQCKLSCSVYCKYKLISALSCVNKQNISHYNTCAGGGIYLMPNASSWLADRPDSLPLGFQDVPVLGHHEHWDKIDNSESQKLGLLTVILWRATQKTQRLWRMVNMWLEHVMKSRNATLI